MIFTASDVSSLSQSLHRWEIAEYIFEGLVIIACAGELVADLGRTCLTRARRDRIERLSTILLVAALSMELICLVKTNDLSGRVIGSLSDKATDAEAKAKSAIEKSALAESKAGKASTVAGEAFTVSKTAKDAAGKAQERAGAVERQADIISSKLLRASRQLDTLEHQVLVQGPRWVLLERSKNRFVEKLKPLAGTKVTIMNCGAHPPFEQEKLFVDLWRFLGRDDDSAGWSTSIATWNSCEKVGFAGNLLISNPANDEAVNALYHALLNAGISTGPAAPLSKDIVDTLGEDSPWALAAKDPTSIFLVVGINPMMDVEKASRLNLKDLVKRPK